MTSFTFARRYLAVAPLLLATPAVAQHAPNPITWTQHVVKSATLGGERMYFISLPADYAKSSERYPVLVMLDAEDEPQFVAALANVRFLASRNEIPSLVIVGVPNGKDRTHDLTPPATGEAAKTFPTAGGADAFLTFLTGELIPAVRSQYRTLPMTVLAGHSFGGLFAVHEAATKPGAFSASIAMSPSLWWNDSTVVDTYADLIAKRQVPHRLFMSSGAFEAPIDVTALRLEARLDAASNPAVVLGHNRYPTDSHGLTPLPSFVDGLRFVFQPITMASTPFNALKPGADSMALARAMEETERRYATGAHVLGLPEALPEGVMNLWGEVTVGYFKQPGAGAAMFRRNLQQYPNSPQAHAGLGDALLAMGDTAAARTELLTARKLGRQLEPEALAEISKKLAALDKAQGVAVGKSRRSQK